MSLPQATPPRTVRTQPQAIRIFLNAKKQIEVSDPERHVKHDVEEVEWQCDDDGFCVSFHPGDCPFAVPQFTRSNRRSGPSKPGAAVSRKYKYTVTAFGQALDPHIIID